MAENTEIAQKVNSREEIPFGPRRIVFKEQTTEELVLCGFISPEYLYYTDDPKQKKPIASIPIDTLLSNPVIINNSVIELDPDVPRNEATKLIEGHTPQDVLIRVLNEESNTDKTYENYLAFEAQTEMPMTYYKKAFTNLDTKLAREHFRAIASRAILMKLPDQDSKSRKSLEASIQEKLKTELEDKIDRTIQIKNKLGII